MHLENGRTSWVEINRSRQWFQYPCLAVRHTDSYFLNFWEEFRNYACVQFLLLPFCLRRCHLRSATHIPSPPRPLSTGKGFHSYFYYKNFSSPIISFSQEFSRQIVLCRTYPTSRQISQTIFDSSFERVS